MPSMKLMSKKAVHKSPITVIEFSLPGKRGEILLATGSEDGTVAVMEVHNDFEIVLEKEDHTETVTGLSFSPGTIKTHPHDKTRRQMLCDAQKEKQ